MRSKRRWSAAGLLVLVPVAVLALAACGSSKEEAAPAATAAVAKATAEAPKTAAAPVAATTTEAPLVIRADTVWGSKGMDPALVPIKSCVQTSRIKPGEQVGWRWKVIDTKTGKALDDTQIDLKTGASVKLADGTSVEVKYGPHGKPTPTDAFWSAWWVVPDKFPTGILTYTISVTAKDGRTATFKSTDGFNMEASLLTVMAK